MTRFGTGEHAERGSGEPLLAIHGFFGGCDEALLSLGGLAARLGRALIPGQSSGQPWNRWVMRVDRRIWKRESATSSPLR